MLSGATLRASAIEGTAVFKIVVSSDSMKNATAISHGNSRMLAAESKGPADASGAALICFTFVASGCIGLSEHANPLSSVCPCCESLRHGTGQCNHDSQRGNGQDCAEQDGGVGLFSVDVVLNGKHGGHRGRGQRAEQDHLAAM